MKDSSDNTFLFIQVNMTQMIPMPICLKMNCVKRRIVISVSTKAFPLYLAAVSFEDEFYRNNCEMDHYLTGLQHGYRLFKQNDKSSADFWRAFLSNS